MCLSHCIIRICNACTSNHATSWQIFSHSPTVPSVLALYTINNLQSLPLVMISITKDALFMTPYTHGKNLQPCRIANTLVSLTEWNKFCLVMFFDFFTAQCTESVLKKPKLNEPKRPSPTTWSLVSTKFSERAVWFGRYSSNWV